MRLIAIALFSLSVAFLVIAIHQVMVDGFAAGYWAVMISTVSFLGYGYLKKYRLPQDEVMIETKDTLKPKTLKKNK